MDVGVISSANIDHGVSDTFATSDGEVKYLEMDLGPLIFMDDIFRMGENVSSAQRANNLMETIIGKKSLEFNLDKSSFMVMGNKKSRKVINSHLMKSPIKLCGSNMKEVKVLKYLGDYLAHSLEESVHHTVLQRLGLAKHSIYEIRAIIEDTRATRLGGINIAFSLWEQTVLPFLLQNCETWANIPKKTMKILNNLFNQFHRSLMRIGTGCPADNFYWQSGSLKPEFCILLKQLKFVHHLANLPVGSLGRDIHDLQVSHSLPGLATSLQKHLNTLGVTDLTAISK